MKHFTAKIFAQLFVRLRNGSETAVKLGVPPEKAKEASARLLSSERVKKEIRINQKGNAGTDHKVSLYFNRFGRKNPV